MAVDSTGNIYIAVTANNRIRKVQGAAFTVWTWGLNGDGQLGNGANTDSNTPVQVLEVGGVVILQALLQLQQGDTLIPLR